MIVYPALDLIGGRAVRLQQGRFDSVSAYSTDPFGRGSGSLKPRARPGPTSSIWMGHAPDSRSSTISSQVLHRRHRSASKSLADFASASNSPGCSTRH